MARTMKVFDGVEVRVMPPTKNHRPALWEGILGTVYARNDAGETRYFDYDWDGAKAFAGIAGKTDLRWSWYKIKHHGWDSADFPRYRQNVVWVERDSGPSETQQEISAIDRLMV